MPRGLEPGLYDTNSDVNTNTSNVSVQTNVSDDNIKRIVQFGTGWIIVELNNGKKVKREGGSLSWRYNNPGNLKYGDFAKANKSIGPGWGGHSVFASFKDGLEAQRNLLFSSARGYNTLSILAAMKRYAPASDTGKGVPDGGNNPTNYANTIAKAIGVSITTKLSSLTSDQQEGMIAAMMRYEGHKTGKVLSA